MRRGWFLVVLSLFLLFACSEDEIVQRFPIEVFMLQYTDPSIAPGFCNPEPEFITVGALVGYDHCQLEWASIEQQGDSLFVSGVALCVSKRNSPMTGAPASPNPQQLTLQLPVLDPGQYVLCAGSLCDTLSVTPACLPPVRRKLLALGEFTGPDSCLVFRTNHLFRSYQITGLDSPPPVGPARLFGSPYCSMPWCRAICDTLLDGMVHAWSAEPAP